MASSGAIGSIDTDNFHATILLRTNTIIARIHVSGLPSADAAKAAAMKAASKFQIRILITTARAPCISDLGSAQGRASCSDSQTLY